MPVGRFLAPGILHTPRNLSYAPFDHYLCKSISPAKLYGVKGQKSHVFSSFWNNLVLSRILQPQSSHSCSLSMLQPPWQDEGKVKIR